MAPDTSWAARLDVAPGKYYRPTITLTGPGLDDLVRHVVEMLADSIHDRDGRADAWTDREADVADAWSALEAELPNAVRLPLVESCAVGRLLDRTASGALHEIGQGRAA